MVPPIDSPTRANLSGPGCEDAAADRRDAVVAPVIGDHNGPEPPQHGNLWGIEPCHAVNVAFGRWFGTAFPFHTLFENVTGSLVMGLVAGYFAFRGDAPQALRLFLTTGILGGYTTFSAFSLEAALLWEHPHPSKPVLYVLLSVAGSLTGMALGLLIARRTM
jgi:fluoride exporter